MKRILNAVIAAALGAGIAGQAAAADLTVRIEGVEAATGTFHVAIFDADGWDGNDAVAGKLTAAEEGAELTFSDLEPGAYGIRIYQDVDNNGELNLGMWGIPSEPYGFSRDASARMGPPRFKSVRFDLPEAGTVQTITLQ
ncbi:DUF2141 domain-containing protein [Hyphomonas sp.]|uniref:DUF2141 domain-containing protein n=1 Tax=Hyphomonas sp. TaxID=87 RepID=UPI003527D15C